ncbi:hypothetical protein [Pedobacter caeni]|uniref:Alpha/beta hydrolase n=1 Tax=Pedobacter caeni TaxID=288992 RepID=A0A1M5BX82_9SPHI|nr:hypothetical protein [Pedobacter caeni]SHF46980.1 hypothetical protein SAMN04488522_1021392 [Pedobacter caeni]
MSQFRGFFRFSHIKEKQRNIEFLCPVPHPLFFLYHANKHAAEPKELVIVPKAGHVDLYDKTDLIPFDRLETFFKGNLK